MYSLDYTSRWDTALLWNPQRQQREHYKRILVVLGEEPWLFSGVDYALSLATRHIGSVHFLSILSAPMTGLMPDMMGSAAIDAANLVSFGEYLLAQASAAADEADIPYSVTLRWGSIPETLRLVTQTNDYDSILMPPCMGTGFENWIHGCLPRRVASAVRQPVITVPLQFSRGATVWQRATVVLNGTTADSTTLACAFSLAEEESLTLRLLYVVPFWRHRTQRLQQQMDIAASRASDKGLRYDMRCTTASLPRAIIETVGDHGSDVVLLACDAGSHAYFRGLFSRATLQRLSVPVVYLPPFAA